MSRVRPFRPNYHTGLFLATSVAPHFQSSTGALLGAVWKLVPLGIETLVRPDGIDNPDRVIRPISPGSGATCPEVSLVVDKPDRHAGNQIVAK